MKTFTFTKRNGHWYIRLPRDLKEFNRTDFAHVENAFGALDEVARGKSKVSLCMDTRPIRKASVLELELQPQSASIYAYYQMRNKKGILLRDHLPLSELSLLLFGELPERIYLRRK